MKFIKSYKVFEARVTKDKDVIASDVLSFLKDSKGVNTQAKVFLGLNKKHKIEDVYTTLMKLEEEGLVSYVRVKDYSVQHIANHPKSYPHYYSTDALTKEEATELGKELELVSKEENQEANDKRKEAMKRATAEKPSRRKSKK